MATLFLKEPFAAAFGIKNQEHCRCTGQDALHWWMSMSHWYWSLTTLDCRDFSLQALCAQWWAITSTLKEELRYTLPWTDCMSTSAGPLEPLIKIWHSTATKSRTGFGIQLPFTAKDLMGPLRVELGCGGTFGRHRRGLVGHIAISKNHIHRIHIICFLYMEILFVARTWKQLLSLKH